MRTLYIRSPYPNGYRMVREPRSRQKNPIRSTQRATLVVAELDSGESQRGVNRVGA